MIVLDENVPESQRELLESRRVSLKQVGVEVGRKGMKDREILSLLHELHFPTFFTLDSDFYKRNLCHPRYCLVYLDVDEEDVAEFVRRFLLFEPFRTHAKRMGAVVRVTPTGIAYWRSRNARQSRLSWKEQSVAE